MQEPFPPDQTETPAPADPPVGGATDRPGSGPADEAVELDALEADLVAVEEAMATLDRIAADGSGGSGAAAQIDAVVSADRFPIDADAIDLT